ncbi:MAG: MBOAT family protein [Clostridia bacterium]|nr:MBOAT family protein [Clostridia bacterium]
MAFSGIFFLFYFLPTILIMYYLAPKRHRNLVLFVGSLFFYAWGEPIYVLLLALSTVFHFFCGKHIAQSENGKKKKRIFWGAISANIFVFALLKYGNSLLVLLNTLFTLQLPTLPIGLPLGFSFYTFHAISYLADVYGNKQRAQQRFLHFGTYLAFFPKLLAGPVVRYCDMEQQIEQRRETIEGFSAGLICFVVGLAKKVLLADRLALMWETIQAVPFAKLSVLSAWLGVIVFGFRIYFDVSGYSDMAIGLGRMFGFRIEKNFDYPYLAKSVTSYWSKWNISLGNWFSTYIYCPLKEKAKNSVYIYLAIFLVWCIVGIWHSATLSFLVWGIYFALIFMLEKRFLSSVLDRLPKWVGVLYTFLLVLPSWVLFTSGSFSGALSYFGAMLGVSGAGLITPDFLYNLHSNGLLLVVSCIAVLPYPAVLGRQFMKKSPAYTTIFVAIGLLLCLGYMVNGASLPFIYFHF